MKRIDCQYNETVGIRLDKDRDGAPVAVCIDISEIDSDAGERHEIVLSVPQLDVLIVELGRARDIANAEGGGE